MSRFTQTLFRAGATVKEYAPEILTVGGVIGTGLSLLFAHKDAEKARAVLEKYDEEHADDVRCIEEAREKCPEEYTEQDYKKEMGRIKRGRVVNYLKAHWRSFTAYLAGVAMIITSAVIGRKRRAADLAAIASLTGYIAAIETRRAQLANAITEGKVKEIPDLVDDEGNPMVAYKCTSILDSDIYGEIGVPYGPYTIALTPQVFCWKINPGYYNIFASLKAAQARCNDVLQTKGYLFLDEALHIARIPLEEVNVDPNIAKRVGWTLGAKSEGDGFVDFGCWEYNEDHEIETLVTMPGDNGNEGEKIYLSFNCDGGILGKIPFGGKHI